MENVRKSDIRSIENAPGGEHSIIRKPTEEEQRLIEAGNQTLRDITTTLETSSPETALVRSLKAISKEKNPENRFEILTITSPIAPEIITEVANLFKSQFDSGLWGQYGLLFDNEDSSKDPRILKQEEVLELTGKTHLEPGKHVTEHGTLTFYHDPGTVRASIEKKLAKDGYLTLILDHKPQNKDVPISIEGYCFGYVTTVRQAFRNEWEDPFGYSQVNDKERFRPFERFQRNISATIATHPEYCEFLGGDGLISPDLQMFLWNCVVVSPNAKGNYYNLVGPFFESLPPELRKMFTACETLFRDQSHRLFVRNGGITVPGTLQDHHGRFGAPQENDLVSVVTSVEAYAKSHIEEWKRRKQKNNPVMK